MSFVVLISLENRASADIGRLEEEIKNVANKKDMSMEAEVISAKKKIDDFSFLLVDHRRPSNFFEFLESATHPQVGFLELELKPFELQAEIKGFATSFRAVAQQIYIFKERALVQEKGSIQEIKLKNLSLGSMGESLFVLQFSFSPAFFREKQLTVSSSPVTDILITADPSVYSSKTNYSRKGIASGTTISLTAPATSGSNNFLEWIDCDSVGGTGDRTCMVNMTADKSVRANYSIDPPIK